MLRGFNDESKRFASHALGISIRTIQRKTCDYGLD
jgi:hypothetical protein